MRAKIQIDENCFVKGSWAWNSRYTGERKPGAIYDLVYCVDDDQIAFMVTIKQQDGILKLPNDVLHLCANSKMKHCEQKQHVQTNEKIIRKNLLALLDLVN